MRNMYWLIALACLALAACSDSGGGVESVAGDDSNRGGNSSNNGNNGNGPSNLSALVFQQCDQMPEDQDAIPINGRRFPPGANNENNRSFTNNCL